MTRAWETRLIRWVGPSGPNLYNLPTWGAAMYVLAVSWKNRLLRLQPRRVNFLIIGAQKAGTTALASQLKTQPDVLFASRKEVFYFTKWKFFGRQAQVEQAERWYHQHFDWANPAPLVGEATPMYLSQPWAPQRVKRYNPQMKLVAILRHPLHRAVSAWNMFRAKGQTRLSFPVWLADTPRALESSRYAEWIRAWNDAFPPDDQHPGVLWLKYEDLRDDPGATLKRVHAYLGLPAPATAEIPKRNVHPYPKKQDDDFDRQEMLALFLDDIAEVEALLGWDCTDWRQV